MQIAEKSQRTRLPANHRFGRRVLFGVASAAISSRVAPFGAPSSLEAAEPHREWVYEASAGQFRVHADFDLSLSAEPLAELDRLSADVSSLLQLSLPKTTMHVVIFGNEQEYRRYLAHYFPTLPERRALFIHQRGTGMLFAHRHSELATDLRHESVHALLNEGAKPLPLWLDEGLAEYFEVPKQQRWRGHVHVASIAAMAERATCPDLECLERISDVSQMGSESYRDAWAWVHFLLHRHRDTRSLLIEHLGELREGRPAPALSRTIRSLFPNWPTAFADHFQQLASSQPR